jgi:hypothetical protein
LIVEIACLDAQAAFKTPTAKIPAFDGEGPQITRIGRGDETFFADSGEIGITRLQSDRALELVAAMMGFNPSFPAFIGESGAGGAIGFKLGVFIV